jgi:hypothetical protein
MDWVAFASEIVPSVAVAIGLAACAGLRAWLPLLLAGGLARAGFLELGDAFQFIASTRALILFGVATVVEIAGDKIPAVDHALDAISTVVRPAAAALLAASVMWKIEDPLTALAVGLAVGAPTALVPHAAKSLLRTASTVLTGGLANPVISLLEDLIALVLFIAAVLVPLVVAAVMMVVTLLVLRQWMRRRSMAAAPPGPAVPTVPAT